jgi:putative protease
MKKHELLVPAGNMDCLKQAVYNGCDAVYLACKSFGARKFANNFDNDEIIEAIKFCHLYGVKVYVTMNTLIKNNEVEAFIDQARFLHMNGIDALIVQDFGMICLLREKFPELEIHASTQANISSEEVCKLYYDLGVKRVVFSRELSIDEIDSIDVPIEKEAFIHGALCISYSGCCLMSSMLGGRSGNRGECAGCCRLPYTLKKDDKVISKDKYLLSTKELNTSSKIDRLLDSSIYSFKIEGRMKSPLYVGFITNFYRHLIDKKEFDFSEETNKLKTIFNREFTIGRMFNEEDYNFMNTESPNHKGLNIGEVIDITKDKIKIKLNSTLNQYDAIRFVEEDKGFIVNYLYDEKDNLISSSNGICLVDNKVDLKEKCVVSKTQDFKLEEEYSKLENKRKVNISIKVKAIIGKELFIEFSDNVNTISKCGNVVQEARSAGVSIDDIKRQLSKLGNTPFTCDDFDILMDNNIFIPIGELNEIRRELSDKLIEKRQLIETEIVEKDVTFEKDDRDVSYDKSFVVRNKSQLEKCLEYNSKIYVIDKDLYEEYKDNSNIYYYVPREVFSIKNNLVERSLVSDYSIYTGDVIGNYTLNVFNIYTAYYLKKIGINRVCLSVELSEEELLEFINLYNEKFGKSNFDILVYGRVENMIIKGNILNIESVYNNYNLVDFKNRCFPVYYDGVNTHILNYENKNIDTSRFTGLCNLRYDFYDEDIDNVINMC